MKKKTVVGIVGTVLAIIAIFALCSCSKDEAMPETEEEFWAEIGELESSAETVFEEVILNGSIENKDIERINNIQDNLERICNSAHTKSYYGEVSYFVDSYKPSFIVTIDKNWKKTQFDCYSFKRGVFQLEGAKCAVLLENAKGPIMENDDFDGIYDIEKKYHIINSKKEAFIVAKGLETGYTLYVIKPSATKLSSSSTEIQVPETHSASTSTQISDKAIMLIYLIVFSLTFLFLLVSFIAEKKKSVLIFAIIALIGCVLSGWALYLICTV